MRKERKAATVFIFVGLLLLIVCAVGWSLERNPGLFRSQYRVDYTLEAFLYFCSQWWIPAGIIGGPMFLISLVLSLWRESKEARK